MSIPSHKLRPDDYSEAHELPVDIVGVHRQLRNLQDDVYGNINEVVQNAYDSNHKGIPNTIRIKIGRIPSEPSLVISDEGRGITQDYGGEIDKFLEDMKATTEKIKRGLNRKGIGLFQYTNIAPRVIITSMDKEMIHRIPMFETTEGATAYGHIVQKPILRKYMEEFGIFKSSTIVAFHGRDPDSPKISEKKLIENIVEKWALRLYDSPEIRLFVEEQEITPPDWIKEHPPRLVERMEGGHDIRGNIWKDTKGNGRLKIFQDGYLVETVQFEPTQSTGYFEINAQETLPGRTGFIKDNESWNEIRRRVNKQLRKFPRIQEEIQDERYLKKVLDLAQTILNLNKVPTAFGGAEEVTKKEMIGDRHNFEVVGYPVSQDPDPERTMLERPGTNTRDPENQTRVGEVGSDITKRTSQEKGKRKEYRALDFQENQHLGADRPLFVLFLDRKPWLLIENADNAEHPIYMQTKEQPAIHKTKLLEWFKELNAEISGEITEKVRICLSKWSVLAWKATGIYPTVTLPVKTVKRRT